MPWRQTSPMVDSYDAGDCYPCLRTFLLPISPAGQVRTNIRPTYGCWPGTPRHLDSVADFAATLRHILSLHQSWDGLVTWQFLGTPLA
jgi:hypothetical protein